MWQVGIDPPGAKFRSDGWPSEVPVAVGSSPLPGKPASRRVRVGEDPEPEQARLGLIDGKRFSPTLSYAGSRLTATPSDAQRSHPPKAWSSSTTCSQRGQI